MLKISNKSKKTLISYGISLQVYIVPVLGQIHSRHNFSFLKQSLVVNQKKYVTFSKLHDEQIGWPTIQFTL